MKQQINLLQVPNQTLSCNLNDEQGNFFTVDIGLRTLPDGNLIASITVNNEVIVSSVMCCNRMPLLPTNIMNGNIYFMDTFFDTDPVYTGFNEQYILVYDTEFKLG
jgi:hypothetical protein